MPSYNIYSNCTVLAIGCNLYTNSGGSSGIGAGYYFDGTTCWVTNSSGVITGTSTCPTPTPTPTATITPTITPTVTPTPTTQGYSVGVYAKTENAPTGTTCSVFYQIGSGTITYLGSMTTMTTTCLLRGTITGVSAGSTVKVGFSLASSAPPSCDYICFDATSGTTTCPTYTSGAYSGIDESSPCLEFPIAFTVNANVDVACTVGVNTNGSYRLCAI